MSSKSARSKRLSNLNSRVITTVLKNEKLADRDLQAKLKSITADERKNMLRLGETTLDMKYDWRRWRNSIQNEDEDAPTVRTPPGSPILGRQQMPGLRIKASTPEASHLTTTKRGPKAPRSPRMDRRPTIVIESQDSGSRSELASANGSSEFPIAKDDGEADKTEQDKEDQDDTLEIQLAPPPNLHQRRRTAPALSNISPKLLLQFAKNLPETQTPRDTTSEKLPPVPRKNSLTNPDLRPTDNDVSPNRPNSPRPRSRPSSPRPSRRLDVPGKCALGDVVDKLSAMKARPTSPRARSPSPLPNSLEPPVVSTTRRRSEPMPIDFSKLPSDSPLRKAASGVELLGQSLSLNPVPVSPRMLRRLSGNESLLQDRVQDFLKSFPPSKT